MAREVICGIYKITNLVNGKIYIGESVDVHRRISQHKKIGRSKNGYKRDKNKPLYRALKKYGIDNFSFEIIEKCSSDDRFEREKYWISYYDCTTKSGKGYNQSDGGESGFGFNQMREAYQYDLDGNFVAKYKSIREATRSIGANSDNGLIQNAISKENKQAGGYQWRYEYFDKIPVYKIKNHCYKVACYDKNGSLLKTFNSSKEASDYFMVEVSTIRMNCKHKINYTKDMMFEYYIEAPLKTIPIRMMKEKVYYQGKPVVQMLNGEIIKIFNNATEAAKELNGGVENLNGANYIGKICRKVPRYKSYKGYKWEFLSNIDINIERR